MTRQGWREMEIKERLLIVFLTRLDFVLDVFTLGHWSKAQGEKKLNVTVKK